MDFASNFGLGALSAIGAKILWTPVELPLLICIGPRKELREFDSKKPKLPQFIRIIQEEGIFRTLGRKVNRQTITYYAPAQGFNFAFNDLYRSLFLPRIPTSSKQENFWKTVSGNFAAGGAAGASTYLLTSPIDLGRIKVHQNFKFSYQEDIPKTIPQGIARILKESGIRGLYTGFGIAIFGVMVYRGWFFGGYHTAKQFVLNEDSYLITKVAVALATTQLSNIVSHPIDAVRRRVIPARTNPNSLDAGCGTIEIVRKMYTNGGIQPFYRGAPMYMTRSCFSAIALLLYDKFQVVFKGPAQTARV